MAINSTNLGLECLKKAVQHKCSDIHFNEGQTVGVRLHGEIRTLIANPFSKEETENLLQAVLSDTQRAELDEEGEVDFPYEVEGVARFRGNAFKDKDGYGLSFRVIPKDIPSMESLGLPSILRELCKKEKGIILVTGPTGSGKSTTLASMVEYMNTTMSKKIITLEEPIEYEYENKKSRISQRQVGLHTQSFSQGLRACLRQDPDVILIGEMRDLETISTAITAGETGHLVLATLHTTSAVTTVERIIDIFPPAQQGQIRSQLSMNLLGIVAQRLLRTRDGNGRVGAYEVLVNISASKNLIRQSKIHQLVSTMQANREYGMVTMEDSLESLLEEGVITEEEAKKQTEDFTDLSINA